MLLIISLLILTILSLIIFTCDSKYWHTEVLEILGSIIGAVTGIAFFIAIIILIATVCSTPSNQAIYEEEYNKLVQRVEHIDSFNKEDVISQVDKWNRDYRTNTYARKSPWIGWFCTIDTSTTSLIELENNNG